MNLSEDRDGIAGQRQHRSFVDDVLVESVDRVVLVGLGGGNVIAHLHEADGRVVVLVELQRDFVLSGVALRNVRERNLEGSFLADVEAQNVAFEVDVAPVPAAHRELLLQHLQVVVFLEELGDLFLIVFEAREAVQRTVFQEHPQAEVADKLLEVHQVDVFSADLFDLSGLL